MNLFSFFNIFFLIFSLFGVKANSQEIHSEVFFGFGMTNVSFQETESNIQTDEETEIVAESGTSSSMAFNMQYNLYNFVNKTLYMKFSLPFLDTSAGGFYSFGLGMRYFFNNVSSKLSFSNAGSSINIAPKLRYYASLEGGLAYLVYLVTQSKKSDIVFTLQLGGGLIYNFNSKWGLDLNLSGGMGVGVATSSTVMQVLLNATYFIDI